MALWVLMVTALLGALLIPMLFGNCFAAMLATHLCILTVTFSIFFGTLSLNKKHGQK